MGLLDKLWDDVVAGPQPDQGLGRLRRNPKVPEEGMDEEARRIAERRRSSEFTRRQEEARRVTQSIAITKRPSLLSTDTVDSDYGESGSTPSTPGATRTPTFSSFVGSPSVFDRERVVQPKAASVPSSPALGSPGARENVWTSVFHHGSNKVTRKIGSEKFDKQALNSPTVYDWVVLSALDR